jgi:hypothetical protein
MTQSNSRLKGLFLDKPECVVNLPQWLLSSERIQQYRAMSGLVIVEIAGRDSVAAAVKSLEEEAFTHLLPTYVYTGTEHGPWASVEEAVERLARRLPEVRIHDLVVLGSPGFWQALNGRFITELSSRYGFYTPCVGCHLYLHTVRIPLALALGNVSIISGEREWHDEAAKINQTREALDVYQGVAKHFGVQLLLPLRNIAEGVRIAEILGFEWEEGKEQLGCVLSKNYRLLDGSTCGTSTHIQRYLKEFALPCAKRIVEAYAEGTVPNHMEIASQVLVSH